MKMTFKTALLFSLSLLLPAIGFSEEVDTDGDGLPDSYELQYAFLEPDNGSDVTGDQDGDGLSVLNEYLQGTSPIRADSDGDFLPDGWEVLHGLSPITGGDSGNDPDNDTYTNLQEYLGNSDPIDAGSVPAAFPRPPYEIFAGQGVSCWVDETGPRCLGSLNIAYFDHDVFPEGLGKGSRSISVGNDAFNTCLISESKELRCFFNYTYANPSLSDTVPSGLLNPRAVSLSYGSAIGCVLDDVGVTCWGEDSNLLGNTPVLANPREIGVSGLGTACSIDDTGLVCWGRNTFGLDQPPAGLVNPRQLSMGWDIACVLHNSGISCWGDGAQATPAMSSPTEVAATYQVACAIDGNDVVCWGGAPFHPLKNSIPQNLINPYSLSIEMDHGCVMDVSGAHCWGTVLCRGSDHSHAGTGKLHGDCARCCQHHRCRHRRGLRGVS